MAIERFCNVFLVLFSVQSLNVYGESAMNADASQADRIRMNYYQRSGNHSDHFRYGPTFVSSGPYRAPTTTHPPNTITTGPTIRSWIKPAQPPLTIPCREQDILLTFSNMGLKRIGSDFVHSVTTSKLRLDMNEIEHISHLAFRSLPNLDMLDLSGNKIPVSKLLLHDNCPHLRILALDDNKIDEDDIKVNIDANKKLYILKDYLKPLTALRVLSLRGNQIVRLDVALKEFAPSLTELYLSRNNITASDFLDDLPKSLTHLHLDDNALRRVQQGVTKNLIELAIDGNKIERLCTESCDDEDSDATLSLEGATKLKKLRASRNAINHIEENAFRHMAGLTFLDLTHNEIKVLKNNTFNGLMNLELLYLGYNRLISIPQLCPMSNLRVLNLTGNNIVGVHADSFCSPSRLESVILSGNRIIAIESGAFNAMVSVQMIDLSDNHITELPVNWLVPVNSLERLLLKNNSITTLDKLADIAKISTLENLHLEANPLTQVKISSIYYYPPNLSIHLNGEKCSMIPADPNDIDDSNVTEDEDKNDNNDINWDYR